MKRKLVIISLILALVALPLAAACAKAPAPAPTPTPTPTPTPAPTPTPTPMPEPEKVWKVAALHPASGPAVSWGAMSMLALEVVQDHINADGGVLVDGEYYRMEVVFYDNKWDPATTATVARKAIFDDGIKYISTYSSSELDAINDLVQREEVLLYGHTSGGTWYGPKYPFTFWVLYYIPDNLPVMLEYISNAHPEYTKVAGIYTDSPSGVTGKTEEEKAFPEWGIEFLGAEYIPAEQEDFYPLLTRLLAKNPDILSLGAMAPSQRGVIIKQAYELGFGGGGGNGIFFYSGDLEFEIIADIAGWDAIEGSLSRVWVDIPTEIGKSWEEEFESRGGVNPGGWTAHLYDGFRLLELAIEKANTFDTWEVALALETVEFDGVFGLTGFGPAAIDPKIVRQLAIQVPVAEVVNGVPTQVYSAWPPRSR